MHQGRREREREKEEGNEGAATPRSRWIAASAKRHSRSIKIASLNAREERIDEQYILSYFGHFFEMMRKPHRTWRSESRQKSE